MREWLARDAEDRSIILSMRCCSRHLGYFHLSFSLGGMVASIWVSLTVACDVLAVLAQGKCLDELLKSLLLSPT